MSDSAQKPKSKGGDKKATQAKLAHLPFGKIKDWESAQGEVHVSQWKKLESGRITDEMMQKRPEFEFWRKEFDAGVDAYYDKNSERIARVWKNEAGGFAVSINNDLVSQLIETNGAEFTQGLVGALLYAFGQMYFGVITDGPVKNMSGDNLQNVFEQFTKAATTGG